MIFNVWRGVFDGGVLAADTPAQPVPSTTTLVEWLTQGVFLSQAHAILLTTWSAILAFHQAPWYWIQHGFYGGVLGTFSQGAHSLTSLWASFALSLVDLWKDGANFILGSFYDWAEWINFQMSGSIPYWWCLVTSGWDASRCTAPLPPPHPPVVPSAQFVRDSTTVLAARISQWIQSINATQHTVIASLKEQAHFIEFPWPKLSDMNFLNVAKLPISFQLSNLQSNFQSDIQFNPTSDKPKMMILGFAAVCGVLIVLGTLTYYIARWYLSSHITLTHNEKTSILTVSQGKSAKSLENIPADSQTIQTKEQKVQMHEYIREACPSLFERFYPSVLLPTGHHQTIYSSVKGNLDLGFGRLSLSGQPYSLVSFYRETITSGYDKHPLAIDWAAGVYDNDKPTVLFLHGLTGGSHEPYIQSVIAALQQHHFRCCVFNARGCANSIVEKSQLYSAGFTADLNSVVHHLITIRPAGIIAIGYSLGGNILTKYLGQQGSQSKIKAAISISNPYDLLGGVRALHRTWIGKKVYSRKLAQNLIKIFGQHAHHFEQDERYNVDKILKSKTIAEFDEQVTRVMFGHATLNDYYRSASCAQYIKHIRVPTLFISALDDPIVHHEIIPELEITSNPCCALATTRKGGHVAWFEGMNGKSWLPRPVVEFVIGMSKVVSPIPHSPKMRTSFHTPDLRSRSLTASREDLTKFEDPASVVVARPSTPTGSRTLSLQQNGLSQFWWVRFLSKSAKFVLFAVLMSVFGRRFGRRGYTLISTYDADFRWKKEA